MYYRKRRKFIPLLSGAETPWRKRQEAAASRFHRRELMAGLLASALAPATGWLHKAVAAALPLGRGRFLELSEKLCAMSIRDGSPADAIQNALLDRYAVDDFRRIDELLHSANAQDVERLVSASGLKGLARSILSAWYSGLLGTGETTRVFAYEEALVWRATGYAKAPGTCGEFGDWITKPASTFDRERQP
jgi:hypothetical protein